MGIVILYNKLGNYAHTQVELVHHHWGEVDLDKTIWYFYVPFKLAKADSLPQSQTH